MINVPYRNAQKTCHITDCSGFLALHLNLHVTFSLYCPAFSVTDDSMIHLVQFLKVFLFFCINSSAVNNSLISTSVTSKKCHINQQSKTAGREIAIL